MSRKFGRFPGFSVVVKANLRWFLLSGVCMAILISGAVVIKPRGAAQPALPVEVAANAARPPQSAPRPSEAETPGGDTAARAMKSQKRRLTRSLPSLTHAARRLAQVIAHKSIETATAGATAQARDLARRKEVGSKEAGSKGARDVARSKAMLEAATPRSLFSVGNDPNVRRPADAESAESSGTLPPSAPKDSSLIAATPA